MKRQPYWLSKEQIIEYLHKNPGSKSKAVSEAIGLSWKNTRRIMQKMSESGLIRYTYPDSLWYICEVHP